MNRSLYEVVVTVAAGATHAAHHVADGSTAAAGAGAAVAAVTDWNFASSPLLADHASLLHAVLLWLLRVCVHRSAPSTRRGSGLGFEGTEETETAGEAFRIQQREAGRSF